MDVFVSAETRTYERRKESKSKRESPDRRGQSNHKRRREGVRGRGGCVCVMCLSSESERE